MSEQTWEPPGWDITVLGDTEGGWRSYRADCRAPGCDYSIFGATRTPGGPTSLGLDSHQAQHAPGRALDIEVSWDPTAWCSVCEDGIGDIGWGEDETVECRECGTYWSINGTGGTRREGDE